MSASGAVRRRQVDRSATTRAALADAAIDVLVEQGWAAVTAVEVCARAGVTRGAFHHHYDSLPALLADALRRLYAQMGGHGRPLPTDLTGLIDVTWAATGHPRFKAVLEAWLAMGNDPSLRAEIGPVVAEFAGLVKPEALTSILVDEERREHYSVAREAMLGLALGRATSGGPLGHEQRVLDRLRRQAGDIEARPTSADRPGAGRGD